MKSTILLCISLLLCFNLFGQVAKTQVVQVNAEALTNGTKITWKSRSFTGNYLIYKRNNLENNNWGNPIATIASSSTSYTDNTLTEGNSAEYRIIQVNGSNQAQAFGYIYAGNKKPATINPKGIILLVDSTFINSLSSEINRLKTDLELEDWNVHLTYAGRNDSIPLIKDKIKTLYNQEENITTLFILGHVPVPYSGDFSAASSFPPPDGHVEGSGNHTGAWAADAYYGDLDGVWSDNFVIRTTGSQTRNHNVIGDGKFDQSRIPSDLELEVGRVDLNNMPAFSKTETELLRDYLNRNHNWRTQQWAARNRAVLDNNFTGLNLASTGYHNLSTFFDLDSLVDADYFTEQQKGSYLWSYGCGAGSYTNCNGIGNTNKFVSTPIDNVFTILAGSFFGDWDVRNNLLRAPLGNSALVSFWGGIPKWYIHTMGLGKHVGYGARTSINNDNFYFNGAFNNSHRLVVIALLGDPSLKNSHLPQVTNLNISSSNNAVKLNWSKATGNFDGYAVYKVNPDNGNYVKMNDAPITDTFYTDEVNWYSGNYTYTVRTIKLENTGSGSYYNIGGGEKASVDHVNSISLSNTKELSIYPNPSADGIFHIGKSNIKTISIFNTKGQAVAFTQSTNQVDISENTSGIYTILIVLNNGETYATKAIRK